MILADIDGVTVAAAAVVSVVSAVAGGTATLLARWLAYKKEQTQQDADIEAAAEGRDAKSRKDAYKEASLAYQSHLRSKDEYIAMQAVVISELEKAQEAWRDAAADCREDVAEQRTVNHFLLEAIRKAFLELKELGRDPGPLPELPTARPRRDAVADFLSRQATQSATAVRELHDSHTTPPKPPANPKGR